MAKDSVLKGIFLLLILFPAYSGAEGSSPGEVLNQLVKELKVSKDPAIVVKYVHWPSAWKSLKPGERELTKTKSPEDLKNYFKLLLTEPRTVLKKQLTGHLSDLEGENKAMLQTKMDSILEQVSEKFIEGSRILVNSDYEVGKETIAGDKGTVELKASFGGQSRAEVIEFIKISNNWWLPSVGKLGNSPVR